MSKLLRNLKYTVLLAVLVSVGAHADPAGVTRVGVVNIAKLVTESPQAASARQKMDQEFSARRKALEASEQKLAADFEKGKKDASVMSAEAKKKLEDDLSQRQRDFLQQKNQYNADVAKRQEQELAALQQTIQETVNQVAKDGKFDLVLSDGIVYAADTINITDRVLAVMRSKAGKQ